MYKRTVRCHNKDKKLIQSCQARLIKEQLDLFIHTAGNKLCLNSTMFCLLCCQGVAKGIYPRPAEHTSLVSMISIITGS